MKLKTGKGGKSFNDRELAARVRTLALQEMEKILLGNDKDLKNAVILRLATTVLPRLNEHTGQDGQPLILEISQTIAKKNAITPDTRHNSG